MVKNKQADSIFEQQDKLQRLFKILHLLSPFTVEGNIVACGLDEKGD